MSNNLSNFNPAGARQTAPFAVHSNTDIQLKGALSDQHINRILNNHETQTAVNATIGTLGVLGIIGAIFCALGNNK